MDENEKMQKRHFVHVIFFRVHGVLKNCCLKSKSVKNTDIMLKA